MTVGREQVAKLNSSVGQGTGFVIEVGGRTYLVTALHVVYAAGEWATSLEAEFKKLDGQFVPRPFDAKAIEGAPHDPKDDWIALPLPDSPVPAWPIQKIESMSRAGAPECCAYGFPAGRDRPLLGRITSFSFPVRREGGEEHSCLCVRFQELGDDQVKPPGMSGGPVEHEGKIIGVLSSFFGQNCIEGEVALSGLEGVAVAGGTRLRRDDGEIYQVKDSVTWMPETAVTVVADHNVEAAVCPADTLLTFISPPDGIGATAIVVGEGIRRSTNDHAIASSMHVIPIDRVLKKLIEVTSLVDYGPLPAQLATLLDTPGLLALFARVDPEFAPHDATSLAHVLLSRSHEELASCLYDALCQCGSDAKLATALRGMFDLAIPARVGASVAAEHEDMVCFVQIDELLALEPYMAYRDGGKIIVERVQGQPHPRPTYAVELEHVPAVGMDDDERATAASVEVARKALDAKGLLGAYKEANWVNALKSRNKLAYRTSSRRFFIVLTKEPSRPQDPSFARALARCLDGMAVIVPHGDTQECHIDTMTCLAEFYNRYYEIIAESKP